MDISELNMRATIISISMRCFIHLLKNINRHPGPNKSSSSNQLSSIWTNWPSPTGSTNHSKPGWKYSKLVRELRQLKLSQLKLRPYDTKQLSITTNTKKTAIVWSQVYAMFVANRNRTIITDFSLLYLIYFLIFL